MIGDSELSLTVQRLLNQAKGVLASRDGLHLDGAELLNGDGGLLSSQRLVDVTLSGALDNQERCTGQRRVADSEGRPGQ